MVDHFDSMDFETVIGLEVHVQLQTDSKIFCGCSTRFGAAPNSQVCPVCLGMPGVLPVLNRRAVEFTMRLGLATGCEIAAQSIFARKNYFYPDLPKGYQISQYEEPLCRNGHLAIELEDGREKRIRIVRIHLEEDAGKSVHSEEYVQADETLVDLNRCGVPLAEVVSSPDFRSPAEAQAYLVRLRQLVRYLEICDGNMEEGSLRCDANISVRPRGASALGVKTELKNMNSIRNVGRALEAEISRQIEMIAQGEPVVQETLLWDANRGEVLSMRSKEHAHDYRYFPEPDLLPLQVSDSWRQTVAAALPELPLARRHRFVEQYRLPSYNAEVLTGEKAVADYFEAVMQHAADARLVSNWVMGEVLRVLNEGKIDISQFSIAPKQLAELINFIGDETVSGKIAKRIFDDMLKTGKSAATLIKAQGLEQIADAGAIAAMVEQVLEQHADAVQRYRDGEQKLLGFFVGQVMQASRGKANPKLVNEILREKLG